MCGEKPLLLPPAALVIGSPPRVRGKVIKVDQQRISKRITPACAGKSFYKSEPTISERDHPRVCGEKEIRPSSRSMTRGSPPRVRGKVREKGLRTLDVRITPACAGKSDSEQRRQTKTGDHPRVCGEKPDILKRLAASKGSPPRVRGKD